MNWHWWGVLSTAMTGLGIYLHLSQFLLLCVIILLDGCLLQMMTLTSGYRTPTLPPFPQEMLSPIPPLLAHKALCCSEPAALEPWS